MPCLAAGTKEVAAAPCQLLAGAPRRASHLHGPLPVPCIKVSLKRVEAKQEEIQARALGLLPFSLWALFQNKPPLTSAWSYSRNLGAVPGAWGSSKHTQPTAECLRFENWCFPLLRDHTSQTQRLGDFEMIAACIHCMFRKGGSLCFQVPSIIGAYKGKAGIFHSLAGELEMCQAPASPLPFPVWATSQHIDT